MTLNLNKDNTALIVRKRTRGEGISKTSKSTRNNREQLRAVRGTFPKC